MPDKPKLTVVDASGEHTSERVAKLPNSDLFAGDAAGFVRWLHEQADNIERDHKPGDRIKFAGVIETTEGLFPTTYNTNPLDLMGYGVILQQDGVDNLRG